MSGTRVRDVLLVGAGGMGRAWLDAVDRRADLRIAAVVDVADGAARTAVDERSWDAPTFTSVDDALNAASADMLLNVTIPEAHFAVSAAAVRAGVPVLSEKPITPTVSEAIRLAALSRAAGVLVATSQSRRHSRGIRAFRRALADAGGAEQLGTVFFQNPRFGGFRDRMPHPLLVDMAIHSFDQARFLLDREPVSVYCEEFHPSWSWYDGGAAAEAVFQFEGGARFSYSGSWCADGLTTSWNGSWRGSAAHGSADWDGEAGVRTQDREGEPVALALDAGLEGLDAALDEFVVALEGGQRPSGEIDSNIRSLAMVEAAVASAESGRRVLLDDVFAAALAAALSAAEGDEERRTIADWTPTVNRTASDPRSLTEEQA
ncbi:putative dehydrogenase [Microbacterium ginsengiterrae]|uniref:Putative dehydrogenase n=1 Tax=Microbacterium ginsengiterrae TaxID=546115 RepID=A0A7W9FAS7_9MICO|nr:putative dehydrogenase [Microbacterium ginsengiterrae]